LVAGQHRLGPPHVGVGRNHQALLALREAEEGLLEFGEAVVEPVNRPA
jgi:hypothetical protein